MCFRPADIEKTCPDCGAKCGSDAVACPACGSELPAYALPNSSMPKPPGGVPGASSGRPPAPKAPGQ